MGGDVSPVAMFTLVGAGYNCTNIYKTTITNTSTIVQRDIK